MSFATHHVQRAALIHRLEHDGAATLSVLPVVLEDVALDEHALRVLDLEEVLHQPLALPARRLEEVVATDLDVGRNECR